VLDVLSLASLANAVLLEKRRRVVVNVVDVAVVVGRRGGNAFAKVVALSSAVLQRALQVSLVFVVELRLRSLVDFWEDRVAVEICFAGDSFVDGVLDL